MDILGPFPLGPTQFKFLIVEIDYLTKWVESEPIAAIPTHKIKKFYWKKLICWYSVPTTIVTDNSTQFTSQLVADFCNIWKIHQAFTSVEHPQTNNQAEASNKIILNGFKKWLNDANWNWAAELPLVLWSYHTTPQSAKRKTLFKLIYGSGRSDPGIDTGVKPKKNVDKNAQKIQGGRGDFSAKTTHSEQATKRRNKNDPKARIT